MGRRTAGLIVALSAVALTGCVERRFRVESNPPGAYVFVNNVPWGPTPVDVPFLFYGDYDILLVKEGYQTQRVRQPVKAPWYEYPFIDFISESLLPIQLTDIRPLYYEMEPTIQPNLELLKVAAEELRRRGTALPKPRYPEMDKKKDPDRPAKKGNPPPTPGGPPTVDPRTEALPPPRELPGIPTPRPAEKE